MLTPTACGAALEFPEISGRPDVTPIDVLSIADPNALLYRFAPP
jgi:hypothetical protein